MKNHIRTSGRVIFFGLGMAILPITSHISLAETPAEACARMAGDNIKLDAIPAEAGVSCASALGTAPQDKQLQYDYARALENSGQRDQAKQIYQWIASDGFAPATAALARMAGPLTGDAALFQKLGQTYQAFADVADHITKSVTDEFDNPNAVLVQTGKDPAKILNWVKTHTRALPYSGMLRGASGVLRDRSGNSLDRALFLADLLTRTGRTVRIAKTHISMQAADKVRAGIAFPARTINQVVTPTVSDVLKLVAGSKGLDQNVFKNIVASVIRQSTTITTRAQFLYGKILPEVLKSVGNDPARDAKLVADADAALAEHFWVQYQKDGSWTDLDPDADVLGYLKPAQTFLVKDMPAQLQQRVKLSISVEVLASGALKETPILSQDWLPAAITDQSITIAHSLLPNAVLASAMKTADPLGNYVRQLEAAEVVVPTIRVGTTVVRGKAYNFRGDIGDTSQADLARLGAGSMVSAQKLSAGIASVFGPAASAPQAFVTAEWLDIEISRPGQKIIHERRPIFDLLGIEGRAKGNPSAPEISDKIILARAMALSGIVDMYIFAAAPPTETYVRHIGHQAADAMTSLAKSSGTLSGPANNNEMLRPRIESVLWAWASGRDVFGNAKPLAPNIALHWSTPIYQPGKPTIDIASVFDIVSNSAGTDTDFRHRVAQGVFDTILEQLANAPKGAAENVATAMASDMDRGMSWTRVTSADPAALASRHASGTVRTAIARDMTADKIVIAPNDLDGSPTGWWTVSLSDGQTKGVDLLGRGDSMVEYAFILLTDLMTFGVCEMVVAGEEDKHYSPGDSDYMELKGVFVSQGICLLGLGVGGVGLFAAESVGAAAAAGGLGAAIEGGGGAYAAYYAPRTKH